MLYHFRGESLDKKKICEELKGGLYNFARVGKEFRLIEKNTKTIFYKHRSGSTENIAES